MTKDSLRRRLRLLQRALARTGPPRPLEVDEAVRHAYREIRVNAAPKESAELRAIIGDLGSDDAAPTSRELFSIDSKPLPCWLPADAEASDGDWLTSQRYYPLYYRIFASLQKANRAGSLLEIGVRTGYMAAVYARATSGAGRYLGLDPNLYVSNGLQLASETCKVLRRHLGSFDFCVVEGYSWDRPMQNTLEHNGPFDIIHVDGDHTLLGKLIDLELARRVVNREGVVLVDDYDYHPTIVAEAVRRACQLGWFSAFSYLPTMRGLAVLRI